MRRLSLLPPKQETGQSVLPAFALSSVVTLSFANSETRQSAPCSLEENSDRK